MNRVTLIIFLGQETDPEAYTDPETERITATTTTTTTTRTTSKKQVSKGEGSLSSII